MPAIIVVEETLVVLVIAGSEVSVKVDDAVALAPSVAVTVKLKAVKLPVGVPESFPVAGSKLSPAGSGVGEIE